ncbi:MAG: single-stranded DNA-binding protein [Alkalilacustris sp.]
MNTCFFTARLGADAVLGQSRDGKPVANFRVASSTGSGDRKQTLWLNCALWGRLAEVLAPELVKGQFVAVSGELSESEYQGKTRLELRVNSIDLGPRGATGSDDRRASGAGASPNNARQGAPGAAVDPDHIPF